MDACSPHSHIPQPVPVHDHIPVLDDRKVYEQLMKSSSSSTSSSVFCFDKCPRGICPTIVALAQSKGIVEGGTVKKMKTWILSYFDMKLKVYFLFFLMVFLGTNSVC
jgi:hypothetical protein